MVLWDVMPYSLVGRAHSEGVSFLHVQCKSAVLRSSETLYASTKLHGISSGISV